jgi:hypothetical protein
VHDESDLRLLGYIAFLDHPNDPAGPAIAALRPLGVEVKILTGDAASAAAVRLLNTGRETCDCTVRTAARCAGYRRERCGPPAGN